MTNRGEPLLSDSSNDTPPLLESEKPVSSARGYRSTGSAATTREAMTSAYFSYWGKAQSVTPNKGGESEIPWHLLPYHSLDVAACGYVMLAGNPYLRDRFSDILGVPTDAVAATVAALLALHDGGKWSESFQNLKPDILRELQGKKSKVGYPVRHDTLGFWLLSDKRVRPIVADMLGESPDTGSDNPEAKVLLTKLLYAITGHHGAPPILEKVRVGLLTTQDDIENLGLFIRDVKKVLAPWTMLCERTEAQSAAREIQLARASWELAGLAVAADWLGSSNSFFPYMAEPMKIAEYWGNYALPRAERAVKETHLFPPPGRARSFAQLFPTIESPTPLQQWASTAPLPKGAKLVIVEEATGAGKTEAALALAARVVASGEAQSVFFALPSMATSNSIYRRCMSVYQEMFDGQASLVLAHGSAPFNEEFLSTIGSDVRAAGGYEESNEAFCAGWLADTRKKSLLAAFGVGTVDQALLAVLPVRHQSIRIFGLARSVLIIDEVHAYEPYMQSLLERLIQFHTYQGGTTILLSATLPKGAKRKLWRGFGHQDLGEKDSESAHDPYPLVTTINVNGREEHPLTSRFARDRPVKISSAESVASVVAHFIEVARAGRCGVWIRNTVDDAIAGYELLRQSGIPEKDCALFHARFVLHDRIEKESDVLERFGPRSGSQDRKGKILVATQVVEQSLDLDFDVMVSDLAPVDLLIQRVGRLHRHSRDSNGLRVVGDDQREPPTLVLHTPPFTETPAKDWFQNSFPKAALVYPHHGQLWLALKLLRTKGVIRIPGDYRELIEGVYGSTAFDAIPEALQAQELAAVGDDYSRSAQGMMNALCLDNGYRATESHWSNDDVVVGTRLSDLSKTVTLCVEFGGTLKPLRCSDGVPTKRDWFLSSVSVRSSKLGDGQRGVSPAVAAEIACLKEQPFLRWNELIVLQPCVRPGDLSANLHGKGGRKLSLLYDFKFGLRVLSGEMSDAE